MQKKKKTSVNVITKKLPNMSYMPIHLSRAVLKKLKEISPLKICYMSQVWILFEMETKFCLVVFDCSREDFEIF